MEHPIALKLLAKEALSAFRVSFNDMNADTLRSAAGTDRSTSPAIVVTRNAALLHDVSAGVIDADDIIALCDGNWTEALLVVLPQKEQPRQREVGAKGDEKFVASVRASAPSLAELAQETINRLRAAGVEGELEETPQGRWVNRPINTFTLKAQPRAGNMHFTLYGNPETFRAEGFLLADQNSYSRGWVRNSTDAKQLAILAKESQSRRKPR